MTIIRFAIPFVVLVIYVFALVDVILADQRRVRGLGRVAWLLIVIFLPIIGAILWFAIGRPRRDRGGAQRVIAPDDDPDFLRTLQRDEEQAERIRRLEQELSELDDDKPTE